MEYDKNVVRFIRDLKKSTKKNGIILDLSEKSHVEYDQLLVNGYFIEDPATLAVGVGKPVELWLPVLVHESCHMDQFIEGDDSWLDLDLSDGHVANDIVSRWVDGQSFNSTLLDEAFEASLAVELDCERRTIEKIIKYNLPIDPIEYAQKANSYLYFYPILRQMRKWYEPGREPYNTTEIWSQMPTTLEVDHTDFKHLVSAYSSIA